jgi:glycosyltransferase involved in cell wall biosynthesis
MKFTILIIAHKREKYIESAIQSVIKQDTSSEIEIIIITNFDSKQINQYKTGHKAKFINSVDESLSGKIKEGLSISTGEYICFLEDDDEFESNKISEIERIIDTQAGIDYLHNTQLFITEKGSKRKKYYKENKSDLIVNSEDLQSYSKIFLSNLHFNLSSVSINRRFANEIITKLPENLFLVVDFYLFLLVLSLQNHLAFFTEKRLTKFRVHNSSHLSFSDYNTFKVIENRISNNILKELDVIERTLPVKKEMIMRCLISFKFHWNLVQNIYSERNNRNLIRLNNIEPYFIKIKLLVRLVTPPDLGLYILYRLNRRIAARMFYVFRKIKSP